MKSIRSVCICCLALLIVPLNLPAASQDDEDIKAFEKMFPPDKLSEEDFWRADRMLISATKYLMDISDAPAIATVITADEIRNSGVRTLLDVIERIPGITINRNHYSIYSVGMRGIKAVRQNKIKFMVDGHTLNMLTVGEPFWSFEDLAVEQVERVEVIRGPGSALYGSNAFSGIINVVTKLGNDINGTQVSLGAAVTASGERMSYMENDTEMLMCWHH